MSIINDIKAKGFKPLNEITPEKAPEGSMLVLYNETIDDFEVITIDTIERGPESYKLYFSRKHGRAMLSSDLKSYYFKEL